MTKLSQRQFHEFSVSHSIDIEHSLCHVRQELTSPMASTEREPITIRGQAWYRDVYMILVYILHNTQMTEIGDVFPMVYLV